MNRLLFGNYSYSNVRAIATLAISLADNPQALRDAFEACAVIDDPGCQLEAVAAFLPLLPKEESLQLAFEAVQGAKAFEARMDTDQAQGYEASPPTDSAFAALIPYLSGHEDLFKEALLAVKTIQSEHRRGQAVCALAAVAATFSDNVLHQDILELACALPDRGRRAEALAALLPIVPSAQEPALLTEVVKDALLLEKTNLLSCLTPRLLANGSTLSEAFTAARGIEDGMKRGNALQMLVRVCPASAVPHDVAVDFAEIVQESLWYMSPEAASIVAIMARTQAAVATAVTKAQGIEAIYNRYLALGVLASALPSNDGSDVLNEVLRFIDTELENRAHGDWLIKIIAAVEPLLSGKQRGRVLERLVSSYTPRLERIQDVHGLQEFAALIEHDPSLLATAYARSKLIHDERSRANTLGQLSRSLPSPTRLQALAEALKLGREVDDIINDTINDTLFFRKAENLSLLTPFADDREAIDLFLDVASQLKEESQLAHLLMALAPTAAKAEYTEAFYKMLAAAKLIEDPALYAKTALVVAGHAPASVTEFSEKARSDALAAIATIRDNSERADALVAVSQHLPRVKRDATLRLAMSIASAIELPVDRLRALLTISNIVESHDPFSFSTELRQEIRRVQVAAWEASKASDDLNRVHNMFVCVRALPVDERAPAILDMLSVMANCSFYESNIETLVTYLVGQPQELINKIIGVIREKHLLNSERVMKGLFPALGPDLQKGILAEILENHQPMASWPRGASLCRVVVAVAPDLAEDSSVIDLAVSAARSVMDAGLRAQGLAAIVKRVSTTSRRSIIDEALEAALETDGEERKLRVLFDIADAAVSVGVADDTFLVTITGELVRSKRANSDPNHFLYGFASMSGQSKSKLAASLVDVMFEQTNLPPRRENILRVLPDVFPVFGGQDGAPALQQVYRTISDVGRWFP